MAACDSSADPVSSVDPGAVDEVELEPAGVDPVVARRNAYLASLVLTQLAADPHVDAAAFDVHADGSSVRLTRIVDRGDAAMASRAESIAARIEGVERVESAAAAAGQPAEAATDIPARPIEIRQIDEAFALAIGLGTTPPEPDGDDDPEEAMRGLNESASGDRPRTYVVQRGDNLSAIAQRTMGDGNAWARIHELNRALIGPNPERLQAGMELRIPQD